MERYEQQGILFGAFAKEGGVKMVRCKWRLSVQEQLAEEKTIR